MPKITLPVRDRTGMKDIFIAYLMKVKNLYIYIKNVTTLPYGWMNMRQFWN